MACSTLVREIAASCGSNLPGVKEVWIGAFDMASFTYTYLQDMTDPDNPVDILDNDGNKIPVSIATATLATGASKMVKFNFRKNTASATNTLNVSDNGSNYFENAITMYFPKQDSDKRLSIMGLVQGETCALVHDKNNNWWFYGLEDYLTVTEGTAETGAAPSDSNGYNVTLTATEKSLPLPVATAAVETLTGLTL